MYDLNAGRGEQSLMDAPAQAEADAGEKGLTQAEIAGAEKLGDALPEEKPDAAVRRMTALGVTEGYALQSVRYSTEDKRLTARLTCRAEIRDARDCRRLSGAAEEAAKDVFRRLESGQLSRHVTLNAHAGALLEMNSCGGYCSAACEFGDDAVDAAPMRAVHFLEKYLPEYAAHMTVRPAIFPAQGGYYNPRVQVRAVR